MPCYDSRSDGSEEIRELRTWLNKATRAACDMRTILRQHGLEHELTPETLAWISMHDTQDAARLKLESEQRARVDAKDRGLAKLSLEERRALGL